MTPDILEDEREDSIISQVDDQAKEIDEELTLDDFLPEEFRYVYTMEV